MKRTLVLVPVAAAFLLAACGTPAPAPTATRAPAPTVAPTAVPPTATRAPAPTAVPPTATSAPRPASSGDAASGKALFTAKGCNACHGANAEGTPNVAPKLAAIYGKGETLVDGATVTVDDAYLTESLKAPTAKVVKGFNPIMPPIALTDAEIKDLIAYIASLK